MALTEQQIVFAIACLEASLQGDRVQLLSSLFDRLPKREALEIAEARPNVGRHRLHWAGFKPAKATSPFEITPEQFSTIRVAVREALQGRSLDRLTTIYVAELAQALARQLNG